MERLPSVFQGDMSAASLLFKRDASGIDMAALQGEIPKWLSSHSISAAVREIEQLTGRVAKGVMVNRLDPGISVPIHTDPDTGWLRYHLPLFTNPHAMWWDEDEGLLHMESGWWWGPVPYTKRHHVVNNGNTARYHLVVDVS